MTSAEGCKVLLDEFFAGKKKRKGIKFASSAKNQVADSRYEVLLNDRISAVAIGDYGADCSTVSKHMMQRVFAASDVELPQPVEPKKEFESTADLLIVSRANQKAIKSLLTMMSRTKVQIMLHEVEFLVTEQSMNESIF